MQPLRSGIVAIVLAACGSTAAVPPAPPQPEPAATPTSDAPTPTEAIEARAELPAELNAKYADQDNPKKWEKRFEREGREAFDKRKAIVAALELGDGNRIADIGAGTGLFTFEFARAVGKTGRVYATDVQQYFLDHLDKKVKKAGLTNVEMRKADQKSPQLDKSSVDVAFLCNVYHHIEFPKTYLAALHEAVAPGGRLIVIDYRRVEGQSDAWIMDHIRAGPTTFRAEIEAAGFRFQREVDVLKENFFFIFDRP